MYNSLILIYIQLYNPREHSTARYDEIVADNEFVLLVA